MKRNISYIVMLAAVLVLTSCSKKLQPFQASYFTTQPNPLEVVGEKVPATITGNIPAKFFVKNAEVSITPTLVYQGQAATSQPYTFQGEKVRGNNPVVNYDYGSTITIPASFDYTGAMNRSELYLDFAVRQGGKTYTLPRVKVANGVIATAALADAATANPALGADAFQRIINEKYAADIKFLINQANVRPAQLGTDQYLTLGDQLRATRGDSTRVIEEINIQSYASPDGALDLNTRLAQQRENATKATLNSQLKKDKITEFGELTAQFTPEDWEGFQKLVAASNIQDKDLILSVLSMYKDPEQREKEIRNLSSVFDQLADQILPELRYSRLTASINVIGKSDAEINEYVDNNPKGLTAEELLYAGTLTDNNARRMDVYRKATEQYPNDYRTWNNLGLTQYVARDYDGARTSFKRATQIEPKATEPKLNLGLISLLNRDYETANQLLGAAAGTKGLDEALGIYYLKMGDNASAARAMASVKSNNAALAQILTKDYSRARTTLAGINQPDATTYYLMAVLGARTNNEQMLGNNLRQAIKLDQKLAQRAAQDLEFANFNLSGIL